MIAASEKWLQQVFLFRDPASWFSFLNVQCFFSSSCDHVARAPIVIPHITEVICFIMYISPGIVGSVFNFIMLLKYCLNRTFTHDVGWFTSRHLTPLPKQLTPFKTLNRLWSPWFLWLYAAEIVVCVQSEASASYLLMWTGYCPFSQLLNLCCDSSSRTIEWTQHRWPM